MEKDQERSFEVAVIPRKGCGVVAKRDIKAGELLLRESPLVTVPWWVRHSAYPGKERKDCLKKQIREFSLGQRINYFSLHDSKVKEGEEKSIDGIWRTNNFALGGSGSKSNNALFYEISRFNHSCVPYAEFFWNECLKKQELRAIRYIPDGCEITISYFTSEVGSLGKKERLEYLESHYGFPCDCPACSLDGEESKRDDEKRGEVMKLEEDIEQLFYDFEDSGVSKNETPEDDVIEGIQLNFHRLHLMKKHGFKVACQLQICINILDMAEEWDLDDITTKALSEGILLSSNLFGPNSKEALLWKNRLNGDENIHFKLS